MSPTLEPHNLVCLRFFQELKLNSLELLGVRRVGLGISHEGVVLVRLGGTWE